MTEIGDAREQSICSMYTDGVSLLALEKAFGITADEIIRVLHRHGVVQRQEGEGWEDFVSRVRQDVKHDAAA